MKLIEALRATIGFDVPDNMAKKALIDFDLDANEEYSKTLEAKVDSAAIAVLMPLKNLSSFSEGGVSYSIDADEVNKTIIYLSNKGKGNDDLIFGNPTIEDGSGLW